MYRVERPKKEPNAVVIYPPDGSLPAYIPICADYAFRMLQDLAAQQVRTENKKIVPNDTSGTGYPQIFCLILT